MAAGGRDSLTGVSMPMAALTTALYGLLSAALATLMALPVALLAVRHPGGARRFLERSTYLVLAMPGVVIALALSYFTERYLNGFGYQTAPLLILAYAIMFFPLALVGSRLRWPGPRSAWMRWPGRWASRGWRCCCGSRCG